MTHPDLLARLQAAQEHGGTTLDLGGLDPDCFLKVPDDTLSKLKKLSLNGCRLPSLPPWVCHLQTLTDLDLSENQLAALPESLGQLTELQSLYIAGNQLTVLPEGVAALASLVEIDAANNRLADLPHDLRHLPLTSLWLQGIPELGLPAVAVGAFA